jgi:hypothetical protein
MINATGCIDEFTAKKLVQDFLTKKVGQNKNKCT